MNLIHGTPHLGNFRDPTDEFVYIALSRKTREAAYQAAFGKLRRIGSWEKVSTMPIARIVRTIHGCGLELKKSRALREGLRAIRGRFGTMDLGKARDLDDEALLAFLTSLPEVGPKSALCVMLYSFGRATFPVDAHVGRVLIRLGTLAAEWDLSKMNHKQWQAVLSDAIPPDLRYGLHVNLVAHGRTYCLARTPRCSACPLRGICAHAAKLTARRPA